MAHPHLLGQPSLEGKLAGDSAEDIGHLGALGRKGLETKIAVEREIVGDLLRAEGHPGGLETEAPPVDRDRVSRLDGHAAADPTVPFDPNTAQCNSDRPLDVSPRDLDGPRVFLLLERIDVLGFRIRRIGVTGDVRPELGTHRFCGRLTLLAGLGGPVEPLPVSEVDLSGVDTADVDGLESELDQTDSGVGLGHPEIDLILPCLAAQLEVADRCDSRQISRHGIPGDVHLLRLLVDQLEQKPRAEKDIRRDDVDDFNHQQRDPDSDEPLPNPG